MEPDDITEIQKTTQLAETTGSQNDLGKNQCELLRAGGQNASLGSVLEKTTECTRGRDSG